jgi:hypothetical protein
MSSVLLFGSPNSDFARTTFLGRSYPDRNDAEGNWISVEIEVVTPPFSGVFRSNWLAGSLSRFRNALEALYATLEGEAVFGPDYERSLVIHLRGDGRGHISVSGEACADRGIGPWLRFELPSIDQTFLPQMISELGELESEYPVR